MSPHVTVAIIIGLTRYLFLFQGMLLFLNFIFSEFAMYETDFSDS